MENWDVYSKKSNSKYLEKSMLKYFIRRLLGLSSLIICYQGFLTLGVKEVYDQISPWLLNHKQIFIGT